MHSEALPVHDGRAGLVVLALGDPHLLEGAEGRRMEPPIHTEYFLSGGATTLIFIVDGASAVSSFVMRSPMPANIVVPPERTTLAYKSLRMSTSHFMIDWKVVSWMPLASLPTKLGWKSTSGQRN